MLQSGFWLQQIFSRAIPLWSVGFPVIRFLSMESTMWHYIGHGNRETNVYQPSSSSNSDWSLCWFGILYKWHTSHNLQINFKDSWVLYYHLNTTITSSRDHYLANAFIFCNVHRSISVTKFSLDVCTQFWIACPKTSSIKLKFARLAPSDLLY